MQMRGEMLFTESVIVNLKYIVYIDCPPENATLIFRGIGNSDNLIVDYEDRERRDKVFKEIVNYYRFKAEHPVI